MGWNGLLLMVDSLSKFNIIELDDEQQNTVTSPNSIIVKPSAEQNVQPSTDSLSRFNIIETEDAQLTSSSDILSKEKIGTISKSDPVSSVQSAMAFGDEGKTEEELLASIKMKQDAFNDAGDE